MKNKLIKIGCIVGVVVLCVLLDQISKVIAINNLVEGRSITLINKFFYWTLCYNTGGAWSIFSDNTIMLVVISIIALCLIVYTLFKSKSKLYDIAASVFMGGLIGNLIDRVSKGKVTDFIDFVIFGYDFPVFNIADIFIVVSAVVILIAVFKEEKENGKEDSN